MSFHVVVVVPIHVVFPSMVVYNYCRCIKILKGCCRFVLYYRLCSPPFLKMMSFTVPLGSPCRRSFSIIVIFSNSCRFHHTLLFSSSAPPHIAITTTIQMKQIKKQQRSQFSPDSNHHNALFSLNISHTLLIHYPFIFV